MNLTQIVSTLKEQFQESLKDGETRKIIFWIDKDQEFIEDIDQLHIDDVQVHVLTENNQFYTKYLLEKEQPNTSYLIYTLLELGTEKNWLADTMYYAKAFYADRVSLILSELKIDPSFRGVVKKHERFFLNKERYHKFQALGIENYNEELIELAVMSVLCNVKIPNVEEVVKAVLLDTLEDNENKYLLQLDNFFDTDIFWEYVSKQYGYEHETPSLKTLFIHLAVTAFSHSINEQYLTNIDAFLAKRNRTNCLVFIDHWMHHRTDNVVFERHIKMVEDEIQLTQLLQHMPIDEFKKADTFPSIDRAIIIYIANGLLEKREDYDAYIKLIQLRRAKHYYPQFKNVYEGLFYAVKMNEFYKTHQQALSTKPAIDLFKDYQTIYYQMDTYYRKFYVAFDSESNVEILMKLKEMVEHLYTHWFMGELNVYWSQAVKAEMTEKWSLPGVLNQQQFYSSMVAPSIRKGDRVFVIISDAFRYEIGVELAERLNSETLGTCEIQPMLGVVPSVTKLGMASLLPHQTLDMNPKGQVYVNGQSTSGLENRRAILESTVPDSMAIHYQEMMNMNKAGRRETFKGKKLIYIYHDSIDAMGDKASTEMYTFDAVEKALNEMSTLIKMIRDDLSGTNILITADHGFLYQRQPLEQSDKIEKIQVDMIETKHRYALSTEKTEVAGQITIDLNSVIKNENSIIAYVPNGSLRNRMQGSGVNFNHGGVSLQEVMVPLLSYKNKRSGQKDAQQITKVDIKLTSTANKITNSIFTLNFFQTEKVEEKTKSRTVVIYMADQEGNVLSNEETVIGDRVSSDPTERTFKLQFVLKNKTYDRNQTYNLIIKDTETGIVTDRIPFMINLGIVSDFDF